MAPPARSETDHGLEHPRQPHSIDPAPQRLDSWHRGMKFSSIKGDRGSGTLLTRLNYSAIRGLIFDPSDSRLT